MNREGGQKGHKGGDTRAWTFKVKKNPAQLTCGDSAVSHVGRLPRGARVSLPRKVFGRWPF